MIGAGTAVGTEIVISTQVNKDDVMVSIEDHGIGIPQSSLDRVFERFYRVSGHSLSTYPGMGLGFTLQQKSLKIMEGILRRTAKKDLDRFSVFPCPWKMNDHSSLTLPHTFSSLVLHIRK